MTPRKKSGKAKESKAAPVPAASEGRAEAGKSRTSFPVVGIGASAGGLAAIESFFAAMPGDSRIGMAFVVVQHLAPDHKSILIDMVKRYTGRQVFLVEDTSR
jgi:two-component system CheB/CheR fusion protein